MSAAGPPPGTLSASGPERSGAARQDAPEPPERGPERRMVAGATGPDLVRRQALRAATFAGLLVLAAFTTVLLSFPLRDLFDGGLSPLRAGISGAGLLGVVVVHALVTTAVWRSQPQRRWITWAVLAEAVVTVALIDNGAAWIAMPVFALSDLLLAFPWRRGALPALVTVVLSAAQMDRFYTGPERITNVVELFLATGFCVAITALVRAARDLERARETLARFALNQERLRVARDLHDTLGRTLVVTLLKLEQAGRELERDPELAGEHHRTASALLRAAMRDMSAVVGDLREVSMAAELEMATSILTSAGITVETSVDPHPVDPEVDRAFGWLIREATTNLLRHSSAAWCRISLVAGPPVRLLVENDGVHGDMVRRARSRGIVGMGERMAQVGGTVRTHTHDGLFVLEAQGPEYRTVQEEP